jgi:hypothetical protein
MPFYIDFAEWVLPNPLALLTEEIYEDVPEWPVNHPSGSVMGAVRHRWRIGQTKAARPRYRGRCDSGPGSHRPTDTEGT